MQAIRTRYLPATNTKPSRMQAKCAAKTLVCSYDHAMSGEANHAEACTALLNALQWDTPHYGQMVGGSFENDTYWAFLKFGEKAPVVPAA